MSSSDHQERRLISSAFLRCQFYFSCFLSSDAAHLASTVAAVGLLSERLSVLQSYVRAVQRRDVPFKTPLMRQIAAAVSQVPASGGDPDLPLELRKVCTQCL